MCRPELIGASGLRSSCASVARNSSLRRSASCSAVDRPPPLGDVDASPYSLIGLPSAAVLGPAARFHPSPFAGARRAGIRIRPSSPPRSASAASIIVRQPLAILRPDLRRTAGRDRSWCRPATCRTARRVPGSTTPCRARGRATTRPCCAVRIASCITSRFSRSAGRARALSTANNVRSATCSSSARFVVGPAPRFAVAHHQHARPAVPPRTSGTHHQRHDLHPTRRSSRAVGVVGQRIGAHVVDRHGAPGLQLADQQRSERVERVASGDRRQIRACSRARSIELALIDVDLAVGAARHVEVQADARHDLAHHDRRVLEAAGRVVDADEQPLRLLAAHQIAASHVLRVVMSRAVFDAPMMWPWRS